MRSKRTSRYRDQHDQQPSESQDEESKDFGNICDAMFAPKKTLKRPSHNTVHEELYIFLVERSSELVLCFLDKHDIDKLARGKPSVCVSHLLTIDCCSVQRLV
jgi:hypothetical protein